MILTEAHQEDSSNSSLLGASPSPADVLLYTSVAAVVFVTMCGNLLVIISICHFRQLHTPTNLLLLSLAVADFLVGAAVMPFHFIMLIDPQWCFSNLLCIFYNLFAYFLTCVSIYSVAFIAVDRFFAVFSPFLYNIKLTVNLTLKIMLHVWLYLLIYNFALLYFNGNITIMKGNITCVDCFVTINEIWAIVDFLIVFIVPCATIIIIYLNIFVIAKKHVSTIRCVSKQQSEGTKINNCSKLSERKAAKTLSILVLVFLLCLAPCFMSVFLDVYIRKPSVYLAVINTVTIMYLNSSINPIIYALFYPWFQKSVKLILTLKICDEESSLLNVLVKEPS